ncbi:MAG: formimidoylglutamate deiminase [Myxococcota bacterium]
MTLPGIANVHSHAFQRHLRGDVQRRDMSQADTFWTWRERMYDLALKLDLDGLEAAARLTFLECLEAGYTAVGEFHYVHHGPDGRPYSDPVATSRAMMRAARQVGIRLTLLWTAYARGGFDVPLSARQARFRASEPAEVERALDALLPEVDGERIALGLALHSVRAVPPAWLAPLTEVARIRGLPIHAHVSEQPQEIAACRDATGLSPVGLLAREGVLGPDFTAVHATWLDDEDVSLLSTSGATVCLCPTTECDLGDGVPRTADLFEAGVPLCIGSDSHAVIDPFAELRMVEYQARAATGRRCVVVDEEGAVAPALIQAGHTHGYRALGLRGDGDRVTFRDDARALQGVSDVAAAALTAGHPGLVDRVEVAGETLVISGRHVDLG